MRIMVYDSYESMSASAADIITERLSPAENPVLCAASGESPVGLYAELARRRNEGRLDVTNWFFVGLDEWIGLDKNEDGSCRKMLDRDLFLPLQVKEDHICFFDGKANDTAVECHRIERFIKLRGRMDVAVLGLGMNGHIGMNEPGTAPDLTSHVVTLHELTKQVGQKYFTTPRQLSQGITLGIATLMKAKHLVLIVNGEKKAAIVQQAIEGGIASEIPASLLRDHPDLIVLLDTGAASLLRKKI